MTDTTSPEQLLTPLNFDDLANLLAPLGTLNSPSELHGLLCGKLAGGAFCPDRLSRHRSPIRYNPVSATISTAVAKRAMSSQGESGFGGRSGGWTIEPS